MTAPQHRPGLTTEQAFLSGKVRLFTGDCLAVLPTLDENSVDSVVTDPPYELAFMARRWDNTGIAFRPETWAAVLRVLKPGGHLLAFGAPRNYHRLVCAIEDGGFEVRDCIQWLFGSGFAKSRDPWRLEIKPKVEDALRWQGVQGEIRWK